METQQLRLEELVLLPAIQVRAKMDNKAIADYGDSLLAGEPVPPIITFYDGTKYIVADGSHRTLAARKAGLETISAEVREGDIRDAKRYALSANAAHGVRRTNKDKRRAVGMALLDEEWATFSDEMIAEMCAVSQTFVSKVRRELTQVGAKFASKRVGKDGKARETANIGKKGNSTAGEASEHEDAGEVEGLQAKVVVLEGLVKERDERITELEDQNARLEQELMDLREKAA